MFSQTLQFYSLLSWYHQKVLWLLVFCPGFICSVLRNPEVIFSVFWLTLPCQCHLGSSGSTHRSPLSSLCSAFCFFSPTPMRSVATWVWSEVQSFSLCHWRGHMASAHLSSPTPSHSMLKYRGKEWFCFHFSSSQQAASMLPSLQNSPVPFFSTQVKI